ncbi:SMI1/KNR4 family protein [Orbus wheelerorum]|uniref:SMI1/KNR4 family protein n=1 Tax=Orbus wheelerorum TaxID=3074111 RepID=UPI00370D1950
MNIKNGFGKLTVAQIEYIEHNLNINLPKDYKQFLIDFNGGLPQSNYLTLMLNNLNETLTLGVLLGINDNPNYNLISWNIEYKSDMPMSAIIIGTDYNSGLYIMITDKEQAGIYYWDNSYNLESSDDNENVYFITSTFTEFMELWVFEK